MKIYEEILEDFEAGKSWDEIRERYRSDSQIYVALRIYLKKAEEIYRKTQMKLEDSKTELGEVEEQLDLAKRERTEVSQEVLSINEEKERGAQELISRREEMEKLNTEIGKLRALGFTTEIVQEIGRIEGISGRKLLKGIKTVEEFNRTRKEFSNLRRKKGSLEKEIQDLQTERNNTRKLATADKLELEELRLQVSTFAEAVTVTTALLKDGFSIMDIESLRHGLNLLHTRRNPRLTVHRLVEGLRKLENLYRLEEKLKETEKKLATMKRESAETKQESRVLKEMTIKAIAEERNAALNSIDNTGTQSNEKLKQATEKFEATLRKGEDYIQRIAEACRDGLGEYSSLQQEAGRLKEHIFYGRVLFGLLHSTDYLRTIPPPVVAGVLDRLAIWSDAWMPEFSVKPSQRVIQKETKLISGWTYNLTALLQLAAEGLRYQREKHTDKHAGDSLA